MDIYRGQNRSQVQFVRDRDTGTDDFQRWILLRPKQQSDTSATQNQTDQNQANQNQANQNQANQNPPQPNGSASRNTGSSSKNPGSASRNVYHPNNFPNGILIEDEKWSAQQRLESDFRKIKTLFNRHPELRDRTNQQPSSNVDTIEPIDPDDLSTKPTDDKTRSAKVIELYDPRSWE